MKNLPTMMLCAAMWGMMTIPANALNEYAKSQCKVKPRFCYTTKPSPRKLRKYRVEIKDISDGRL